ncbi:hypothetical protein [Kibdelosporangium phytohabitans]|uniref:Uncharacterized protein n=1 Tax=Kibdelosporangium phytohabitans TaxID=860235 RepID=A0A0N9I7V8_9PSEU|nr:hypothetical protein [Kibdelosporangium phytohabitans]ALG14318.1 hypothetical protein AOZ06_52235 [Kibdelosporangium phytohabitans]MBE1466670.1 hypothetical protein [Kibdelosporangium phytohabitans]
MSQYVSVAAAMTITKPRLQTYLRTPVAPASTWALQDWTGVCDPWSDSETRRRYRDELADAVKECDSWIDGDYAGLWRDLDELTLGFDPDTGSLAVDFDTRADFQLPSVIWACTVLRGLANAMADNDSGLITITADWDGEAVLSLHVSPGQSAFLGRGTKALAEAKDAEFDVRCAVTDSTIDGLL